MEEDSGENLLQDILNWINFKIELFTLIYRAQGNWKMHEKKAHPEEYEKIFKPYYKRPPNERVDVEKELKILHEKHMLGDL